MYIKQNPHEPINPKVWGDFRKFLDGLSDVVLQLGMSGMTDRQAVGFKNRYCDEMTRITEELMPPNEDLVTAEKLRILVREMLKVSRKYLSKDGES